MKGKDCGSYGGYLHTDHAIRKEFFDPHEAPAYKEKPYLMDFTYIFDSTSDDHLPFMVGEPVTLSEIELELGRPADMRVIDTDTGLGDDSGPPPSPLGTRIEQALARCRRWRLTQEQVDALL